MPSERFKIAFFILTRKGQNKSDVSMQMQGAITRHWFFFPSVSPAPVEIDANDASARRNKSGSEYPKCATQAMCARPTFLLF